MALLDTVCLGIGEHVECQSNDVCHRFWQMTWIIEKIFFLSFLKSTDALRNSRRGGEF